MAVLSLGKPVDGFSEICKTLAGAPDYKEAAELIQQANQVLQTAYDELLRKIQLMGHSLFEEELKLDSDFWRRCNGEWGRGAGYRDRVATHNQEWFKVPSRIKLESELRDLIAREWARSLERVDALFDVD